MWRHAFADQAAFCVGCRFETARFNHSRTSPDPHLAHLVTVEALQIFCYFARQRLARERLGDVQDP
jgi:hypothetical protein